MAIQFLDRFTTKFFCYLRHYRESFPDKTYFGNLTEAIRYAIDETGNFKEDFYFVVKTTGVSSQEVRDMINYANNALLISPRLDTNAYDITVSKNAAKNLLKHLNENKEISYLVDKVEEYFVKAPELKREFESSK